eukprot:evm.model.NODE_26679_length_19160_cov_44.213623.4
MEIRFFVKLQQQQQQSKQNKTKNTTFTTGAAAGFEGELAGAALDVFLIERDPA